MTWLWWAIPLIPVVFLWTLNEFLRGKFKEAISGVLALIIFFFIGMAFFISGWKIGIAAIIYPFFLSNLMRPFALALARYLIDYPDLGFDDYSQRQHERFKADMADFGSEDYFKRCEQEKEEEARHRKATISLAMKIPAIAELLTQFDATERDLAELYNRIEVHSLPPRIRETVLKNVQLVRFFLENSEPCVIYDGTYGRKVSSGGTAIRLQLWTHSNPGGQEPHPR